MTSRLRRGQQCLLALVVGLAAAQAAAAAYTPPLRSWKFQYQISTKWASTDWINGVTVRVRVVGRNGLTHNPCRCGCAMSAPALLLPPHPATALPSRDSPHAPAPRGSGRSI
jgi:hypothetical protein